MITLYHGSSSIEDLKSIMKNGFDLNKIGSEWGCTMEMVYILQIILK